MTDSAAKADRAAAAGDIAGAIALLEQAGDERPDDPQLWLKLAALRRAAGQPAKALDAVHRALALAEFDFMALSTVNVPEEQLEIIRIVLNKEVHRAQETMMISAA